jgi:E3 ubiquitin-protein ligase DOA10
MARNVPARSQVAHDETHELRSAIRRAAVIKKLIRRHLTRIAQYPAAGASPRDRERTMQVMSDLLETLEQNTRVLQRALAFGRGQRVFH